MNTQSVLKITKFFICSLFINVVTYAQTEIVQKRGIVPNASYSVSDFETVNNTNGNISANLPLVSLPAGRGGMSYGINLSYNSKLWDVQTSEFFVPPPGYEGQVMRMKKSETGGWRYGIGYRLEQKKRPAVPEFHSNTSDICHSAANPDYKYFDMYKFVLTMPDGSQKEFTPVTSFSNGNLTTNYQDGYHAVDLNGKYRYSHDMYIATGDWGGCEIYYYQYAYGMTFRSTDDSFLRLDVAHDNDSDWTNNSWVLTMPDGTRVTYNEPLPGGGTAQQRIYDRNNNYVEITKTAPNSNTEVTEVIDQLGRKISVTANLTTNQDVVTMKGANNSDLNWTIKWKKIYVKRDYWASEDHPMVNSPTPASGIFCVVEKIILPSQLGGQSYEFGYNGDSDASFSTPSRGFGEISTVTLPSGAKIDYDYKLDGILPTTPEWKEVFLNPLAKKTLSYETQYDGMTSPVSEQWLYNIDWDHSTTTAPDGGVSKAFYNHLLDDDGYVYLTESPDGSKTSRSRYGYGPYTQPGAASGKRLWEGLTAAEFTTIPNAAGTPSKTIFKAYDYDMNGNRIRVKEYDWLTPGGFQINHGEPVGVTPIKVTEIAYYNPTDEIRNYTPQSFNSSNLYYNAGAPRAKNLVKSVEIKDQTGQVRSRSEMFYDDVWTSGNLTETKNWDNFKGGSNQAYSNPLTSTNSVSSIIGYDTYGNPIMMTDAKGVQSKIIYGTINGYSGLYPTQTISAYGTSIARTSTAVYDFNTGLTTSTTDVDNNVTSATTYDDLGRSIKSAAAVGTPLEVWTQSVYDDVNRMIIVKSDVETKGDARKVATQFYDQLGRVRLSKSLENVAIQSATNEIDGIKVQTRYLTNNGYSYQLTSNPYRANYSINTAGESGMGWTRSMTANTGRHSETETFSGASLPAPWGNNSNTNGKMQTDIDADITLVTNQAGKQHRSLTNVLGQLIRVDEPDKVTGSLGSISNPVQPTYYKYNTLGKMIEVTQGSQQRFFLYDSLGRIIRVRQPEQQVNSNLNLSNPETTNTQWTGGFSYDNNSNVLTATDAKNVTTTNTYDALNRALTKNYSDGTTPAVSYTYDDANVPFSKGKLTKVSSVISETAYTSYDEMGRLIASNQKTPAGTETLAQTLPRTSGYKYNLAGILTEQTYPSNRIVKNILESDGNLSSISSRVENGDFKSYASNIAYTASGVIKHLQIGNGLWESATINSRNQVTELNLGNSPTDGSLWKLNYGYGVLNANGTVDTTKNAGNIVKQTVSFTGLTQSFVQTYKYDFLNRIKEAKEVSGTNQTWIQSYDYDRYGNRTSFSQNILGQQMPINNQTLPAVDTNTNKFQTGQGYNYDANGNLIQDFAGRQFIFDGDNKQVLVKDSANNPVGRYFYDGNGKRVKKVTNSETTIFIYDGVGKLVAEYSTATPVQNPTVNYTATDPLGSPRVITNKQGQIISRRDFMPFGEEISPDSTYRTASLKYGAGDNIRQKFTGYQRDEETNLDFAEARYYNNAHGRFTAVDPLMASGKSVNPQTFNRYAYTMNRPLILTDSTGLQAGRKLSVSGSTATVVKPAQPAQYTVIPGTTTRVQTTPEIPAQIDSKSIVSTNDAVNKILSDYATKVYNNEVAAGVATDSIQGAKGVGTLKSITLEVSVGGDVTGKDAGKISTELSGSADFEITDPSDIEQARRQANGDLYNSAADQLSQTPTETNSSPNKPVQLGEDQIKGLLTDAGRIAKDEASKRRDLNKDSNDDSDKARRRP